MAGTGSRGGKHHKLYASGYYGRHDAGVIMNMGPGGQGTKREFIGSDAKEYKFVNKYGGTRIIIATSYEEALRIAKSLGFSGSDYKKR